MKRAIGSDSYPRDVNNIDVDKLEIGLEADSLTVLSA